MINSASDFKYITPPTGVTVDGNFLADNQSQQPNTKLMWQDIGFLIEATKERDFICQCRPNNVPYPFFYNTQIRGQNVVNASKWIANRFNNTGSYPEYAYLGTYLDTSDPSLGTPMFLDESESSEDIITSKFTDVTSWTYQSPVNITSTDRVAWLAGNDIYKHICSQMSGVQREAELSSAHELVTEPIVKMQKNIDKLRKVFYGCCKNIGWGTTSPSVVEVRTRPYIWSIAKIMNYSLDSHSSGQVWNSDGPYFSGIDNGSSTNWGPYWDSGNIYVDQGWTHYQALSEWNKCPLCFHKDIQSKVKSAKLYVMNSCVFTVGAEHGSGTTTWKWMLTKFHLAKGQQITLSDGAHDGWFVQDGYADTRDWLSDIITSQGYTLRHGSPSDAFAQYSTFVNFLEVDFEPNTILNTSQ